MKILRLVFIIPVILLLSGLGVLIYLFKDSSITSYLEEKVPGLDITKMETTLADGEVHFHLGGDYLNEENQQNLVHLETMQGSVDFSALGFGAVIIPNVHVDHLVIQPELFTHFSSSESTDQAPSGNAESDESGELIPDFDLENFDRREWLERFTGEKELASEKYINSMRGRAKKLKDQWDGIDSKEKVEVQKMIEQGKTMISDWEKDEDLKKIKTKIDRLKKDFEALQGQKFDKDNIAGILQNIEKIKNLQKETESVKTLIADTKSTFQNKLNYVNQVQEKAKQVAALPKQIQHDVGSFQKDLKGLQGAIKQDQELLKKELNFKNFDTVKITRLLFGKEWSDQLKGYLDMWYTVEAYLPSSGNTSSDSAQPPKQQSDQVVQPVKYQRFNNLPDWALKHLSYTGRSETVEGEKVSFQGNLHHISSDEAAHGHHPAFDLFGRIAGTKGGTFNIMGAFSTIDTNPEKRYMKLNLKGRKLKDKVMGKGSSEIIIKEAMLTAKVELNLSKVPYMFGKIILQLEDPLFDTGEKVKPMIKTTLVEALQKTFTEPLVLHYEYQKGWDSPKIKVDERLNEVFKDATNSLVSSFAKEQQDKLLGDFSQKMTGESSSMLKNVNLAGLLSGDTNKNLSELSQNLLSNLNIWNKSKNSQEQQVNQQQELLNQLLASMSKESNALGKQQDGLKSQAEDLLKKSLGDKLFGGGSKSSKKNEGQKGDGQKKDEEKSGVKSIEKALKGLF